MPCAGGNRGPLGVAGLLGQRGRSQARGDGIRDRLCPLDDLVVPQPAGERRSHVDHPHDRLRRLGAGSEGRLAGLSAQALSLDSGIVAEVGGPVGPRQRGRSNPHRQPGQLRRIHRAASRHAELAEAQIEKLTEAMALSAPSDMAPSPPSNSESVATGSQDRPHLPTKGTWTANDSGWSIKLTIDGNQLVANLRHSSVFGRMKCRGEVNNLGKIKGWCSGGQGFRKLRGTFPHVQLYYYGTFGATFIFDLHNENQR